MVMFFMRKPTPIELEISVCDNQFLQDKINHLFLDIIKHKLDNSNVTIQERISYIDNIIEKLKSG